MRYDHTRSLNIYDIQIGVDTASALDTGSVASLPITIELIAALTEPLPPPIAQG